MTEGEMAGWHHCESAAVIMPANVENSAVAIGLEKISPLTLMFFLLGTFYFAVISFLASLEKSKANSSSLPHLCIYILIVFSSTSSRQVSLFLLMDFSILQ